MQLIPILHPNKAMATHLLRTALFLALLTPPAWAIQAFEPAAIDRVAGSRLWHRLLHYKHHWFHGYESAVDGEGFFLSPHGKEDPRAELLATIDAFLQEGAEPMGKSKLTPQCAFPARLQFLERELGLRVKRELCPKFENFMARFNAESATLVFSAAYPNNPASMFGHTFLRINQKRKSADAARVDLLDFGLSYAAMVPPDENNFLFMWFGLTGGYPGQLSMMPYYAKVNEYTNSESRDLWEYELNLSPEETQLMLANAWEVEMNSYLDYYFFDENCSWLILRFLEVAKPDWEISDFLVHAIPGETVKRITDVPGAVKKVSFRPSLYKKLLQQVKSLSPSDLASYRSALAGKLAVETVDRAPVLDALLTRLQYEKQKDKDAFVGEWPVLLRRTLVKRSKTADDPDHQLPPVADGTRPDLGHHATRWSVGGGISDAGPRTGGFVELGVRSAYHDLFNVDLGFSPFNEISFPGFTLRWYERARRLQVEEAEALAIVSLQPVTEAVSPLSWRARVAWTPQKDLDCISCRALRGEGGVGWSWMPGSDRNVLWTLTGARAEVSSSLTGKFRWLPWTEAGVGRSWGTRQKVVVLGRALWDVKRRDRQSHFFEAVLGQTHQFSREWEARLLVTATMRGESIGQNVLESRILLNRYF